MIKIVERGTDRSAFDFHRSIYAKYPNVFIMDFFFRNKVLICLNKPRSSECTLYIQGVYIKNEWIINNNCVFSCVYFSMCVHASIQNKKSNVS